MTAQINVEFSDDRSTGILATDSTPARHKGMFFAEKAADRSPIDYAAAISGGLRLMPVGDALKALEEDYARMGKDGLLLEGAEPFELR